MNKQCDYEYKQHLAGFVKVNNCVVFCSIVEDDKGFEFCVDDDRGGGCAGRAIALPLFCWDLLSYLLSKAPVDMEKIPVKLLDFSLKGGGFEPVVFDEFLRTLMFVRTITTRCV